MNNQGTKIEQVVLRRVQRIHALRYAINSTSLSIIVFAIAIWDIGREVWVARVLENAPAHFSHLPSFYLSAFVNTDTTVQLFSLLAIVALVYIASKTSRMISNALIPVRA